jgi:hypothetical protein
MGQASQSGTGNPNGKGFSSAIQNVTPQKPFISGTGIQQAQSNGKGQSGGSSPMPQQLMAYQPPGQAQNTITSGQPIMGLPNQYMNTVAQNQQNPYQGFQNPMQQNGKGKG